MTRMHAEIHDTSMPIRIDESHARIWIRLSRCAVDAFDRTIAAALSLDALQVDGLCVGGTLQRRTDVLLLFECVGTAAVCARTGRWSEALLLWLAGSGAVLLLHKATAGASAGYVETGENDELLRKDETH